MDTDDSRAALREEIDRLRAALVEAERAATVDPLTGCVNRRGWTASLGVEERRCQRHSLDAVVVIVDLDGLKAINDTHGHDAGDRRLIDCAAAIRSAVRAEDVVARLGGDEFAVLAVQSTLEGPHAVVAQIQQGLDDADVSASLGWALRSRHGSLANAVAWADCKMLARKRDRAQAGARTRTAARRTSPKRT